VRVRRKNNLQLNANVNANGDIGMPEHASANTAEHLSPENSSLQSDTIELDFSFPQISSAGTPSLRSQPGTLGPAFEDAVLNWPATDLNEREPQDHSLENDYTFNDSQVNDIFGRLPPPGSSITSQQPLSPMSQGQPRRDSITSFSQPTNDYQNSGIDFDLELGPTRTPPSLSRGRHFQAQSPFSPSVPSRRHTESGSNSQCVIVCSQIILSLEKYLVDELKVFDLILGIVKQVIEKLNPLVSAQLRPRNAKCLALFGTIIYQVIELLEAGCTNFLAEELGDTLSPSRSDSLGGNLNALGFGGFGSGDQKRLRSQLVLEELQPIVDIARKVLMLSSVRGKAYDGSVASEVDAVGCQRNIERRLKHLVEKVRRCGGL
jgi:hypothetical protein